MANIVQLKDSANAVFYPQTHEKAVVDSNGVNLQTKLASITTPTYMTAWDGESTPVVANIPAGVTVTYDDTDYTGTLVASASTTNKTYLVSTGTTDNYNRYVTQLNGSTYSWQPLGSTEIDLSDYATKAELSQLDQESASLSEWTPEGLFIDSNNKWSATGTPQCFFIPVAGASKVKLVGGTNASTYAFLKSLPSAAGDSADYATGASRTIISAGAISYKNVPSDANYLYVPKYYSSADKMLSAVIVDGYDYVKGVKATVLEDGGQTKANNNGFIMPSIKDKVGITFRVNTSGDKRVQIPVTIPNGTAVTVKVISGSATGGTPNLTGRTNEDDQSGFSFGAVTQGDIISVTVTRDVNFLSVGATGVTAGDYQFEFQIGGASFAILEKEAGSLFSKSTYGESDLVSGYYNLSGTTASAMNESSSAYCFKANVHKGDIVRVFSKGVSTYARAWALTDYDKTILTVAANGTDTLGGGVILEVTQDGLLYANTTSASKASFRVDILQRKPTVAAPCMWNPKVDLKKQNLRILDIGNSYTADAQHYLEDIVSAAGITAEGFSLYRAIRSGASFKDWVNCYNDADTDTYWIGKTLGDDVSGVQTGTGEIGDGAKFRATLAAGWDIILIHQYSKYANDYDAWAGDGDGGYLKEYIRIIRQTNPNAVIGFLLVHSYRSTYSDNVEGSSLVRWKNNAESVKKLVANYGIDFVIPYGTAVQNLRASEICDSNEFSTDGTHMADGIGDYVASCCYFQCLIAPRFDKCILGNTFRKTDLDETEAGVLNIDNTNAPLAQKAALAAAYDWYNLHNPDDM